MEPKFISGIENVNKEVYEHNDKVVMFLFTASWCGPCKQLKKELYTSESEGICFDYKDKFHVIYLDADNEENEELLQMYEVSALPTQVLVKLIMQNEGNVAKIDVLEKLEGCDVINLRMKLDQHCK